MTNKEIIEVVSAAEAGKRIECRSKKSPREIGWSECSVIPAWNFSEKDYRVKPVPREFWIILNANDHALAVYDVKQEMSGCKPWKQVHVREVPE